MAEGGGKRMVGCGNDYLIFGILPEFGTYISVGIIAPIIVAIIAITIIKKRRNKIKRV